MNITKKLLFQLLLILFLFNFFQKSMFAAQNKQEYPINLYNINEVSERVLPNPSTYPEFYTTTKEKNPISVSDEVVNSNVASNFMRSFTASDARVAQVGGRTEKLLIIPLEFTNVKFSSNHNSSSFAASATKLKEYYENNSQYSAGVNGITIDSTICTTVESIHTMEYYGADSSSNGIDHANVSISQLAMEAINILHSRNFDFSSFDSNSDGIIDHVAIIHAGSGQESVANTNLIWSCSGEVQAGYQTMGFSFITVPENTTLGVLAHEFGHQVGLPDLYDTNQATNGYTFGVGRWDIMGVGSWNYLTGEEPGTCPSNLSAWCKSYLGWITPTEITQYQISTISNTDGNSQVFLLRPTGASSNKEYFLAEYRRKIENDMALPGEGLLVWHIDEEYINQKMDSNLVNAAASRIGVELEQADGNYDLWTCNNYGDVGDPFPGITENKNFITVPYGLNLSNTNSTSYNGTTAMISTGVEINNISVSGSAVTAAFNLLNSFPSNAASLYTPSSNSTVEIKPTFTWDIVSGARSYILQIAESSDFTVNLRQLVLDSTLTYKNNKFSYALLENQKLDTNKNYYWRIAGINEMSTTLNHIWSNTNQLTTTQIENALTIPSGIQYSSTAGAIALTWSSVNDASGYYVNFDGVENYCISNSFIHSGLLQNSKHIYKIRAVNASNASVTSQEFTAYTSGAPSIVADTSSIIEGNENSAKIILTLSNGTFRPDGNFNIGTVRISTNSLPTGVTVASILRTNPSTVEINLTGNSTVDYDINRNVIVVVETGLVDTARYSVLSASTTIVATVESTPSTPSVTFSFDGINAGKLIGITTAMEYSLDGGTTYTLSSANDLLLSDTEIYSINSQNGIKARVKATLRTIASNVETLYISQTPSAPSITIDNMLFTISGIDSTMEFSTYGSIWTRFNNNLPVFNENSLVYIRIFSTGTTPAGLITESDFIREAPLGITFSFDGVNAGKLIGSTVDMEYSVNGGSTFMPVSESNVQIGSSDLNSINAQNDIKIRYKSTTDSAASHTLTFDILPCSSSAVVSCNDTTNQVYGISSLMEFSADGINWTKYNNNLPSLSGNVSLRVRISAVGITASSSISTLTFTIAPPAVVSTGGGGGGGGGGGAFSIVPPTVPDISTVDNKILDETKQSRVVEASSKTEINLQKNSQDHSTILNGDYINKLIEKKIDLIIKDDIVNITIPPGTIDSKLLSSAGTDSKLKIGIGELTSENFTKNYKMSPNANDIGLTSLGSKLFDLNAQIISDTKTEKLSKFNTFVTVTFLVNDVDLSKVDTDELGVYYFNEGSNKWEYVGGKYDMTNKTIKFKTNHFSLYTIMKYEKTFDDVKNHWALKEIEKMASRHIAKGKTENKFYPNSTITRAEFIALLGRTLELKEPASEKLPFNDVAEDSWYYNEIGKAYNTGIVTKFDGISFRPEVNITRKEMVVMITRALSSSGIKVNLNEAQIKEKISKFKDSIALQDSERLAFAVCIEKEIVRGRTETKLEPKGNATRSEAIVILRRLLGQI